MKALFFENDLLVPFRVAAGCVRPAEQVPLEALVRLGPFRPVPRTQPKFKVSLMIGRQFDANLHIRVDFVRRHDDSLAVAAAVFVRPGLLEIKKSVTIDRRSGLFPHYSYLRQIVGISANPAFPSILCVLQFRKQNVKNVAFRHSLFLPVGSTHHSKPLHRYNPFQLGIRTWNKKVERSIIRKTEKFRIDGAKIPLRRSLPLPPLNKKLIRPKNGLLYTTKT